MRFAQCRVSVHHIKTATKGYPIELGILQPRFQACGAHSFNILPFCVLDSNLAHRIVWLNRNNVKSTLKQH